MFAMSPQFTGTSTSSFVKGSSHSSSGFSMYCMEEGGRALLKWRMSQRGPWQCRQRSRRFPQNLPATVIEPGPMLKFILGSGDGGMIEREASDSR